MPAPHDLLTRPGCTALYGYAGYMVKCDSLLPFLVPCSNHDILKGFITQRLDSLFIIIMPQESYDAVVVGAGFAGIFQLKRLRDDVGLKCLVRSNRSRVHPESS